MDPSVWKDRAYTLEKEAVEMEFYPSPYSQNLERSLEEPPASPEIVPRPRRRHGPARRWAIALGLLLALAAVRLWSPKGAALLRQVFLPERARTVEAMAVSWAEEPDGSAPSAPGGAG